MVFTELKKFELSTLLDELLDHANATLADLAECRPFSGALHQTGDVKLFFPSEKEQTRLSLAEQVDRLRFTCRHGALSGQFRATAIGYQVRRREPDLDGRIFAIEVALDHRDNYSAIVRFPYEVTPVTIDFGEMTVEEGDYLIFGR